MATTSKAPSIANIDTKAIYQARKAKAKTSLIESDMEDTEAEEHPLKASGQMDADAIYKARKKAIQDKRQ